MANQTVDSARNIVTKHDDPSALKNLLMRIICESVLDRFRGPRCEVCGERGGEPHHVLARGMGGGGRMDVSIGLICLCRTHHQQVHDGNINRRDLLVIIAKRELTIPEDVIGSLYILMRLRKDATWMDVEAELANASVGVGNLVRQALLEANAISG